MKTGQLCDRQLQCTPCLIEDAGELLECEFDDLSLQWTLNPSPQNKSSILKKIQPVIVPHLQQYGDNPTLRGGAKLLAIDAMGTYDPSKGSLRAHIKSGPMPIEGYVILTHF